jgi:hypothetical protein
LHALAILHSARYLTDGFIEDEFVEETFDASATKPRERERVLRELETRTMWVRVEGGWRLHDYLDWNPSRAQVLEKRKRDAERKALGRGNGTPRSVQAPSARTDDGQEADGARPGRTRPTPTNEPPDPLSKGEPDTLLSRVKQRLELPPHEARALSVVSCDDLTLLLDGGDLAEWFRTRYEHSLPEAVRLEGGPPKTLIGASADERHAEHLQARRERRAAAAGGDA